MLLYTTTQTLNSSLTQIFTLVGVILSFIVGAAGLWIAIKNARKTNYINSVTSSRIKYIQDIRNKISDFCGLVYSYNTKLTKLSDDKLFEIQKEFDKLKYLIKLHLNPEDTYWDDKILKMIDDIIALTDKDPKGKIDGLITITQYLLKLEWEGAKRESENGALSPEEKKEIYDKHIQLYENHLKQISK